MKKDSGEDAVGGGVNWRGEGWAEDWVDEEEKSVKSGFDRRDSGDRLWKYLIIPRR